MNWKNRLTNYNFWVSIVSAIILVLQALKIKFDVAYINEIVTAVLGLLVVIGIINDPTKTYTKTTQTKIEVQDVTQKIKDEKLKNDDEKIIDNNSKIVKNEIENLTLKTQTELDDNHENDKNLNENFEQTENETTTENEQKIFQNLKNNAKKDNIFEKTSINFENLEKNLQNSNEIINFNEIKNHENFNSNVLINNENLNSLENNANDKLQENKISTLTENLIPYNQKDEIVVDPVQNNLQVNEVENLNAEFSENKNDNQIAN